MSSTFRHGINSEARTSPEIWQIRSLAVAVAAIVNVAFALIARGITGEFPSAKINGDVRTISVAQVAVTTILVGLIAWAVRSGLGRTSSRPPRAWSILAPVALAVSLVGPLGSGVDGTSKVVLAGMHFVAAALIIPAMRSTARR